MQTTVPLNKKTINQRLLLPGVCVFHV